MRQSLNLKKLILWTYFVFTFSITISTSLLLKWKSASLNINIILIWSSYFRHDTSKITVFCDIACVLKTYQKRLRNMWYTRHASEYVKCSIRFKYNYALLDQPSHNFYKRKYNIFSAKYRKTDRNSTEY